MPPKPKVSKTDIVTAALTIVRESGAAALNARAVAAALGVSTQPVFSHYATMDELRGDVITSANALYQQYLSEDMARGDYPPYKASGMAYIRFAREERELFRLLFMRDRSKERIHKDSGELAPLIQLIRKNTGLSEEDAFLFHLEMWVCVHGIATMIATSYLEWDVDMISRMLTDCYMGLTTRYCGSPQTDAQDQT